MTKGEEIMAKVHLECGKVISERDRLLLERDTVLRVYTEWLIDSNFILTGVSEIDYVGKFRKAVGKAKRLEGIKKRERNL